MKYRFVEALNNFLLSEGRKDLINTQLDCHSTIQLELNELSPINIDLSGNDVILWSCLSESQIEHLKPISYPLLSDLLEYAPRCFPAGQPAMNYSDNNIVLSGVMHEDAMTDPELFAATLEEFYERSHQLTTLLTA